MSNEPESVTITLSSAHGEWSTVIYWLRKTKFGTAENVATQIEAQLPKPKPEEPTGFGAVIRDTNGVLWTGTGSRRLWHDRRSNYRYWNDLDYDATLSLGVPE